MGTIEEVMRRSQLGQGDKPGSGLPRSRRSAKATADENYGASWITDLREVPIDTELLSEQRVIGGLADESTHMAYKMLRTRALQRMRQGGWNVIMVTSPEQGDGKSLTALNFAISLAKESMLSVVLLDLDLRRPGVSQYLGIRDTTVGVAEYLDGKVELEEVLCRPAGIDRLAVMPNTSFRHDSSELLGSPRMAELMTALRGAVDGRVVICDLPPLLATDDALAFSPLADAVLLVVAEGATSRDSVTRAGELISDMGILGVVLNRSHETSVSDYGYS